MSNLPEHIDSWIKELRSGNHVQTIGTLKRQINEEQIGYCCLGVFVEKVEYKIINAESLQSTYEGCDDWYELCDQKIPQALKRILIDMNDNGCAFIEIAKFIENWYASKLA